MFNRYACSIISKNNKVNDFEREIAMSVKALPHDHGNAGRVEQIKHILENTEKFAAAAEAMSLLSDSSRLRIFWLLCHCEECVLNISAITGMSSPAVSHHLRILREAGLLVSRRDGKEVYYCAADTARSRELHAAAERLLQLEGCPLHGGD